MEKDKEKYSHVPDAENDLSSSGEKIDRSLFELDINHDPFEPNKTFQDLIKVYPNALTPEFCEHCIEKFEEDPYKYQGEVSSGVWGDTKRSTDLTITDKEHWKAEDTVFHKTLTPKINSYVEEFVQYYNISSVSKYFKDCGYQIQRTKPGEFYVWHNDFSIGPNKDRCRFLTFIWYLNDIHEDGYTQFIDGTKIQPKQGSLLIFPATWTYSHRGYPPKSETKYICTGWIHSDNTP